jgi:predicted ester cyclase
MLIDAKRILSGMLLFGAAVLASGCQNSAAKADLEKFRAQAAQQEQNKAVVQKLIDGLNKQDSTVYAAVYAPNAAISIPSTAAKPSKAADDLKMTQGNWKGFPDLKFSIEEMVAEGDRVMARLKVTGTHTAAWNGMAPSGKKVEIGNLISFRLENGMIVEQREEFDALGLFTQLGMELRPAKGK